jgi:hypothetical protein
MKLDKVIKRLHEITEVAEHGLLIKEPQMVKVIDYQGEREELHSREQLLEMYLDITLNDLSDLIQSLEDYRERLGDIRIV